MDYKNNSEPSFLPNINLKFLFDRWGSYSTESLYLSYFNRIPSHYTFGEVDLKKFHQKFSEYFKKNILGCHYQKYNLREDWESDFIYVLEKELIVKKNDTEVTLYFQREDCELLKEIFSFTKRMKKKEEKKAHINLIIMQPQGLDNRKIDFEKPELDLSKIYNEGFQDFHEKMLQILRKDNRSGLHLLYGTPGTGKSTYIRYLCGQVKKKIVFLPGQMAQNLDNVAMTKYLINNANSVLVIEDAEELIVSRDQKRNSNLAMILNITDGILGESLGIQIIATFNTDVKNIDPALKRKGRLKSAYEFKALSQEKANRLLIEQNMNYSTDKKMTLAEIYNFSEDEQYKSPTRKAVGFR